MNVQNAAAHFRIARCFNFTKLATLALCYIERCFAIVCETHNFLELDYTSVAKLLSSFNLRLDSELEALEAADDWVSYNYDERSKFGKALLLKVRLPLLTDHTLNSLSSRKMALNEIDDCAKILKEVSKGDKSAYTNNPHIFNSARLCSQEMFNILISGGVDNLHTSPVVLDRLQEINGTHFNVAKGLAAMTGERYGHKKIYCRGAVYVFAGCDSGFDFNGNVDKYSLIANTWERVADNFERRKSFCACAFMDRIFIGGGFNINTGRYLDSCMMYDTKHKSWKAVARMNERRSQTACAVFEERIVVCGGFRGPDYSNTVEAFDHVANKWTYMPNMNERRFNHSSVAVKNKLFVIGYCTGSASERCEVFDSAFKQFVFLKPKPDTLTFRLFKMVGSVSIGNRIITLGNKSTTALCYDIDKNEWTEEPFQATKDTSGNGCVLIPRLDI